ncbi:MAG TPA: hypothetical protein VF329_01755 [Gammaproteobacteria bacterium]
MAESSLVDRKFSTLAAVCNGSIVLAGNGRNRAKNAKKCIWLSRDLAIPSIQLLAAILLGRRRMSKRDTLAAIDFGQRVAEEEGEALAAYFVETDNWRRVFAGDIDVIYGPKGSGKSALYSLLVARTNDLFDRDIILVPAENPRGTPAFRDLTTDPPATEAEFINLWKLYSLSLLASCFDEYGIVGESAKHLKEVLAREGLAKTKQTLQGRVQSALRALS